MDRHTLERVEKSGSLGGIWAYVIARPENERVTVIDRVVTFLSRIAMFLILIGVAITFYEVFMRIRYDV